MIQQSHSLAAQLYKRLQELKIRDSLFDDKHFLKGFKLVLKGKAILLIRRVPFVTRCERMSKYLEYDTPRRLP